MKTYRLIRTHIDFDGIEVTEYKNFVLLPSGQVKFFTSKVRESPIYTEEKSDGLTVSIEAARILWQWESHKTGFLRAPDKED